VTTVEKVRSRAESDARTAGCYLNPDKEFLNNLFEGLKANEDRYGYPSCPCRLATGKFELDRDIICPCDYRDPDVAQYGACYCALFVSKDISEGKKSTEPVPERRPIEKQNRAYGATTAAATQKPSEATQAKAAKEPAMIQEKLWYCKQCGYVCYREEPPYVCPVCKAKRELFAELAIQASH
jgi:ferredoxin-thioredoxin reductase catalytic subunit/predicted Zn-ribbon and HTH transcriptional regulator